MAKGKKPTDVAVRRRQKANLKIAQLELKSAIALIEADLDEVTAADTAFSLHSASLKCESVSIWLKSRDKGAS